MTIIYRCVSPLNVARKECMELCTVMGGIPPFICTEEVYILLYISSVEPLYSRHHQGIKFWPLQRGVPISGFFFLRCHYKSIINCKQ